MEANRPAQGLSNLREIKAYERERPLEERLPARTVYGALRAAALEYPERTALTLVMTGDDDELPALNGGHSNVSSSNGKPPWWQFWRRK